MAKQEDLRRISLDTPNLYDIVIPVSDVKKAADIGFDPVDKYVYWSNSETVDIKRSRIDGTGMCVALFYILCHGIA